MQSESARIISARIFRGHGAKRIREYDSRSSDKTGAIVRKDKSPRTLRPEEIIGFASGRKPVT